MTRLAELLVRTRVGDVAPPHAQGGSQTRRLGTRTGSPKTEGTGLPIKGRLDTRFATLAERCVCFALCVPSGAALLLALYGLIPMQIGAIWISVPGIVLLVVFYCYSRGRDDTDIASRIEVGAIGGLLGTLGYDLVRVPFVAAGMRIFVPISVYGVWIADASMSSDFTEILGWTYHLSNGLTFGIIYALFMMGRHWGWAIGWAMLLETIALGSPFSSLFGLSGNYTGITVAYLGHVAYGWPLGRTAQHHQRVRETVHGFPRWAWGSAAVLVLFGLGAAFSSSTRDAHVQAGHFLIEGVRLNPDILRIDRGDDLQLVAGPDAGATVRIKTLGERYRLGPGESVLLRFPTPGVHQLLVESSGPSRSSFVIVEPVALARATRRVE